MADSFSARVYSLKQDFDTPRALGTKLRQCSPKAVLTFGLNTVDFSPSLKLFIFFHQEYKLVFRRTTRFHTSTNSWFMENSTIYHKYGLETEAISIDKYAFCLHAFSAGQSGAVTGGHRTC